MGLDSIELLYSFEKYFDIQVPNIEAENILTVQEMVDCVAAHLSIGNDSDELKLELYEKWKSQVKQLESKELKLTDTVFSILDIKDKEFWKTLSVNSQLAIPLPNIESDSIIHNIFPSLYWKPTYDWKTITVDQFITAILAKNYEKVIDNKSIKSKYEILIAIIAITVDKIGVDYYEVLPKKRFANDLGVD